MAKNKKTSSLEQRQEKSGKKKEKSDDMARLELVTIEYKHWMSV